MCDSAGFASTGKGLAKAAKTDLKSLGRFPVRVRVPPSAPIKSGTSCILQGACFFMSRHVAYKKFPRISNEYKRPPAAPRNMNATWVGM